LSEDRFIWLLGTGFIFSAILGLMFDINQGIMLGLSLFAFCITCSDFFRLPQDSNINKSFIYDYYKFAQGFFIAISIPLSMGIPLIVRELFVNYQEVYSKLSSYAAIFSLGLALMIRSEQK
jgi:hypothetical protein